MNADTIAALERAALYAEQRRNSLLSDMEGLATEEAIELGRFALMHGKDAALIRAHIETLRAGGERGKPSLLRCSVCKGMTSPIYGCACNNWDDGAHLGGE